MADFIKYGFTTFIPENPFAEGAVDKLRKNVISALALGNLPNGIYEGSEELSPTWGELSDPEDEGSPTNLEKALLKAGTPADLSAFFGDFQPDYLVIKDLKGADDLDGDDQALIKGLEEDGRCTEEGCWLVEAVWAISIGEVRSRLKEAGLLIGGGLESTSVDTVDTAVYLDKPLFEHKNVASMGEYIVGKAQGQGINLTHWVYNLRGNIELPINTLTFPSAPAYESLDSPVQEELAPPEYPSFTAVEVLEQGGIGPTVAQDGFRWRCRFYSVGTGIEFTKENKDGPLVLSIDDVEHTPIEGVETLPPETVLLEPDDDVALKLFGRTVNLVSVGEAWISAKYLVPIRYAWKEGRFAYLATKDIKLEKLPICGDEKKGPIRTQLVAGRPWLVPDDDNQTLSTYNVVLEYSTAEWKKVMEADSAESGHFFGWPADVNLPRADREFLGVKGAAAPWLNAVTTYPRSAMLIKIEALGEILKYYNVEFDPDKDTKNSVILRILPLLIFGNIKIEEYQAVPNAGGISGSIRRFMVSVPCRFVEALKKWEDVFDYDANLSEDELKDLGMTAAKRNSSIDALMEWFGMMAQERESFAPYLASMNKVEELRVQAIAGSQASIIAKDTLMKTSFATTFRASRISELKKEINTVFKYYNKKIKNAKASVSYLVPQATVEQEIDEVPAGMGALTLPLDLDETYKKVEVFFDNLDFLLSINDSEYKEARPDAPSSPGSPKSDDFIELGFDKHFNLIYVLFNGFPMSFGTSYWMKAMNDPAEQYHLVNTTIHRFPAMWDDYKKKKKDKWDEWVKKNIVGVYITHLGSERVETTINPPDEEVPAIKGREAVALENAEVENKEELLKKLRAANIKIEDIRGNFWKDINRTFKTIKTIDDIYNKILNVVPIESIINQVLSCAYPELAGANLQETIMNLILNELFDDYAANKESIDRLVGKVLDVVMDAGECTMEILAAIYVVKGVTTEQADNLKANVEAGIVPDDLGTVVSEDLAAQGVSGEFSGEDGDYITNGLSSNVNGVPMYKTLPESAMADALTMTPKNSPTYLRSGASSSSETLLVLQEGDQLKRVGSKNSYYQVEIVEGPNVGLGKTENVYVRKSEVRRMNVGDYGVIALLGDLVKVQASDLEWERKEKDGRGYRKVRVVDAARDTGHFGTIGYIDEEFLRPMSEAAKTQEEKLLSLVLLTSDGLKSRDGYEGLINEVSQWQQILINAGFEPTGGADGIFGPSTTAKTQAFAQAKSTTTLNPAYFTPLLQKGFVTLGAYKYFLRLDLINQDLSADRVPLSKIEADLAPAKATILGGVLCAPPGFYEDVANPGGPCTDLYVRLMAAQRVYDMYLVAAKTKPEYAEKRDDALKIVESLLQSYTACAQAAGWPWVTGNDFTYLYSKDLTDEEVLQQDAYTITITGGDCQDKKETLMTALAKDPGSEASSDVIWPGAKNATDEQLEAYNAWIDCINGRTTEKASEIVQQKEKAQEAEPEVGNVLSAVLPDYPLPTTIGEVFTLFAERGIIPVNLEVHPDAGDRFWKAFSSPSSDCFSLLESIAELIIEIIMEEFPEIAQAVRMTIQTFQMAMEAYRTVRSTVENLETMYKTLAVSGIPPKFPVGGYDKHFKKVFYAALERAARDLIMGLINSLLAYMMTKCNEQDGLVADLNDVAEVATSVADAYMANPDNAALFNDMLKGYNILVDKSFSFNAGTKGIDAESLIENLVGSLTQTQLCSIIHGTANQYTITAVKKSIVQTYPSLANIVDDAFITNVFAAISAFVGPDYCLGGKIDPTPQVSQGLIPCLDNYADGYKDAALDNTDLSLPEQADYKKQSYQDAIAVIEQALQLMERPTLEGPDNCEIVRKQYLEDEGFIGRVEKNFKTALTTVQKNFDTDITNFIPKIANVEETFEDVFAEVNAMFASADKEPGAFSEAIGNEINSVSGELGLMSTMATYTGKAAQATKNDRYNKKVKALKEAMEPAVSYVVVPQHVDERPKVYLGSALPDDENIFKWEVNKISEKMAEEAGPIEAARLFEKGRYRVLSNVYSFLMGASDYEKSGLSGWSKNFGRMLKEKMYEKWTGPVSGQPETWDGTVMGDPSILTHKDCGIYMDTFEVAELPPRDGRTNIAEAQPGSANDRGFISFSQLMPDIENRLAFLAEHDTVSVGQGEPILVAKNHSVTNAMSITSSNWALAWYTMGFPPETEYGDTVVSNARFQFFNLKPMEITEYLTKTQGIDQASDALLPGLQEELEDKTLEDVTISNTSTTFEIDVDFDYRVEKYDGTMRDVDFLDYTLFKGKSIGGPYTAKVRETLASPLILKGGLNVKKQDRETVDAKIPTMSEKSFYGVEYILSLAKENLAKMLNVDPEALNSSKMRDASNELFTTITREAIVTSLNETSKSKFFNLSELATITLAPTLNQINENCEDVETKIGGKKPKCKSVLDVDSIRDFMMVLFKTRFDPCADEQTAYKDALIDGYIVSYMRTFIADYTLKGIFAASQMPVDELLSDNLIKKFLYAKFAEELKARPGNAFNMFKNRAPAILDVYRQHNKIVIVSNSKVSALLRLFNAQIAAVAQSFKCVTKVTGQADIKQTVVYPHARYTVTNFAVRNPEDPGDIIEQPVEETLVEDLFHGEPPNIDYTTGKKLPADLPSLSEFMDKHNDGAFLYQRYVKVSLKAGADNLYKIDDYIGDPSTQPHVKAYVESMKNELQLLQDGGLGPYYIVNPYYLVEKLFIPPDTKADKTFFPVYGEVIKECFDISAGTVMNYITRSDSDTGKKLGFLDSFVAGGATKAKFNIRLTDYASGTEYYLLPLKNVEKQGVESLPSAQMNWLVPGPPSMSDFAGILEQYYDAGKNSLVFTRKFEFFSRMGLLEKEIEDSPELHELFTRIVPLARYAGFSFLYTGTTINETYGLGDLFEGTKTLLLFSIQKLLMGHLITGESGTVEQEGVIEEAAEEDNAVEDILMGFIAKMLITTPLHIVKGVAEVADPNIALTKKIFDSIDFIFKISLMVALQGARAGYSMAYAAHATAVSAAEMDPTGETPSPEPMAETFDEWWEEATGLPVPDPAVGIPWEVAYAIAPTISLSMLPSMLPFGVGFPPPPLFGPGIGPPMTMLAIPYLAFGLIKVGTWDGGTSNTKTLCPTPSSNLNLPTG